MSDYVVIAQGCDDATYALVDLTDEEAAALTRVSEAINPRATYSCKPTLLVVPADKADAYDLERATEAIEENA